MKETVLYLHEAGAIGGAENSLLELAGNIDRGRFEPVFACPAPGPFAEALKGHGVAVYPVEFSRIRGLAGTGQTLRAVRQVVRRTGAGLIHSNSIRTHIYGVMAGRAEGSGVVWHERNLIEKEVFDPERLLSFLPDRIICNSNAVARRFLSRGKAPEKVVVIHNGVDTERFRPSVSAGEVRRDLGIRPDEVVVGMAGRFSANKGHEVFLRAASIVAARSQGRAIRFLVAGGDVFGEGPSRESAIKKLCADMGLSAQTVFTGVRDDMPRVYAAMDIFVLPSLYEACSRAVIEAMASGKAVVGSAAGGTPEVVVDGITGFVCAVADAGAMAEGICALLGDKARREAMGMAGRKRVEEFFTIARTVAETERVYDDVLRRRQRAGARDKRARAA